MMVDELWYTTGKYTGQAAKENLWFERYSEMVLYCPVADLCNLRLQHLLHLGWWSVRNFVMLCSDFQLLMGNNTLLWSCLTVCLLSIVCKHSKHQGVNSERAELTAEKAAMSCKIVESPSLMMGASGVWDTFCTRESTRFTIKPQYPVLARDPGGSEDAVLHDIAWHLSVTPASFESQRQTLWRRIDN